MKQRLDQTLVNRGLISSRSQAESYIKLGHVKVNTDVIHKVAFLVAENDTIELTATERYVSRAALKLGSVVSALKINFKGSVVLDVGSSTGGFTDYALQHGATQVIAVDVGTNQLHPSLRSNPQIELHEQTDIRKLQQLSVAPTIVVIDVSFISLRDVLPHIGSLIDTGTQVIAMVKPQFEAGGSAKHKGVIKNEHMRRDILKDFEKWAQSYFVILDKADSKIQGTKGNRERFYLLKLASR